MNMGGRSQGIDVRRMSLQALGFAHPDRRGTCIVQQATGVSMWGRVDQSQSANKFFSHNVAVIASRIEQGGTCLPGE